MKKITKEEFVLTFRNSPIMKNICNNIACSACGERNNFRVEFTGICTMTDMTTDDTGDHSWDATSFCKCNTCGEEGVVGDFTIPGLDDYIQESLEPKTLLEKISDAHVAAGRSPVTSWMSVERFDIEFWRASQYKDYAAAKVNGGVYAGEVCYGGSNYADAMTNVRCAMTCCNGAWRDEELMIHLTVDGVFIGDLSLEESY